MADDTPTEDRLHAEPFAFDFFQAVRLLRELAGDRGGPVPAAGTVRFAAYPSLAFAASAVHDLEPATPARPPRMTVTFLGLTGPYGVMPRHYTELLLRIERDVRQAVEPEKYAVRDWFDLFTHRFVALFYGAWEKYRFVLPFGRGEAERDDPDPFTRALLSLIGLGTPRLRGRLRLDARPADAPDARPPEVDDLGLFRFAGLLAQRHRSAWGLGVLLGGYFRVPAEVRQFQGRWLMLDPESQTRMPAGGEPDPANCALGQGAVAGDRVWDVRGKFRVRLGPLTYAEFLGFLPEPDPPAGMAGFALLSRLARFYAGPEFDFDVQLVLLPDRAPPCVLDEHAAGPRLGWNCWLQSVPIGHEVDDPVFDADSTV